MTIGIGVLCSSQPKPYTPRPDSVILVADTMGSTQTDSTDDLHKMWINDDLGIWAVGAGMLEYSGEIIAMMENEIKAIRDAGSDITHGRISTALNKCAHIHKSQHFNWDVMPKLSIVSASDSGGQMNMLALADPKRLLEEWQSFYLSLNMVIATRDVTGQMYLYKVGHFTDEYGGISGKTVSLSEFPGYATIGTGGQNANTWLDYRRQVLGLNAKQSAYHAYEAKQMAARAPTVNDKIEIAVVLPNGTHHLSEENPVLDGCPVSLPELDAMFLRFGPRKTEDLGHPKQQALGT